MIFHGSPFGVIWLLLLLILAISVLYRPIVGAIALAAAIPLRTVLPKIGPLNFPWLVGFIAVLGLLYYFVTDRQYRTTPLDLPIVLLILAQAVSMFFTPLDPFMLRNYLSIGVAYGTYFLVTNLINKEREFELVLSALLLVGAFHAFVTFYFLAFEQMPFFVPVERLNRVANVGPAGRFWGTMGSTSSFAMFFVFLMPLAVGRAITTNQKPRKVLYAIVVVAFATSLGATQVRSGLLGAFVMFSVFGTGLISLGKLRKQTAVTSTVASLIPAGTILFLTGYLQSFWNRFTMTESFWGGRPDRFYHAIEIGLSHPLGAGKEEALVAALAKAGAANPKKVHNVVLGLFAQTGYLGLVGILWIIVAQVRTNISILVSDRYCPRERITLLSTFAGIAGYWTMAMFFFKHDWGFVFFYFGLNMTYIGIIGK